MFRFNNSSSFNQLIILLIITLCSWLLISISAMYIGTLIWNIDLINTAEQISANPGFARYFQITQSIALFIIPPLLFAIITQNNPLSWLKILTPNRRNVILAILIVLIAQPLVSYLGYLNSNIHFPEYLSNLEDWITTKEEEAMKLTEIFLLTSDWFLIVLNVTIIAVIPAIGEELLFRGALQKLITAITNNYHISILITAFLFSAMHMQFFGFFPRFFLGVIFGYLIVYGKSIWLPITAHFINNFSAFILYNISISKDSASDKNPLSVSDSHPNFIWVTLSAVGIIIIIAYLKKKHEA